MSSGMLEDPSALAARAGRKPLYGVLTLSLTAVQLQRQLQAGQIVPSIHTLLMERVVS